MPTFTDTLKDASSVAGSAFLGASGPAGRGSATSLLNNRLRLAEAQRQSDLELSQISEEKERKKLLQTVELVKSGLTDPASRASIEASGDLEKFQNLGRTALSGLGQPPELVDLFVPEQEEVKGTRRNAFVGGNVVPAIENEQGQLLDPASGNRMTGATLAPVRTEQAGPGGFSGVTPSSESKAILEIAEARSSQEDFIAGINQVVDFYRSENFVGGLTGTVLQGFNSALRQASQVLGEKDPLIIAGKLNIDTLDENLSAENVSLLRRAAISGNVRDSALMRLSFILAKRFDPGGRISNQDVTNARDILTGSADQAAAILQLENVRDLSNASFNRQARNTAEAVGLQNDPRFRPIPTGGKKKGSGKSIENMSREEAINELFNF